MSKAPAVDLPRPVPKEEKVEEPLAATVSWAAPEEEATRKISVVGRVEVPCTDKVATGEDEPMPTRPVCLTIK